VLPPAGQATWARPPRAHCQSWRACREQWWPLGERETNSTSAPTLDSGLGLLAEGWGLLAEGCGLLAVGSGARRQGGKAVGRRGGGEAAWAACAAARDEGDLRARRAAERRWQGG